MIVASNSWDDAASSVLDAEVKREHAVNGGRPCLVVNGPEAHVACDVMDDALPCVAQWKDSAECEWQRFELPGSNSEDIGSEQLRLFVTANGVRLNSELVEITGQLQRLRREDSENGEAHSAETAPTEEQGATASEVALEGSSHILCAVTNATTDGTRSVPATFVETASLAIKRLIDQHVDWVHRLFEQVPDVPPTNAWQGACGGIVMRRLNDAVDVWRQVTESDEPRMALIVKLSRELPTILERVCRHPRRVLRRERQMQCLGRVREVDPGCLRWLARQPGLSVAERAGSRQQVLAIVRVEDVDTPENRVVRDLLARASLACAHYVREHRGVEHDRVRDVKRFRRLIRSLMKSSPITEASQLVGIPQPNYVLQMDPNYSTLWDAYLQLVKQQQLEDNVWRWRQRLFAEHVQVALIAALQELTDLSRSHGGDLILQREQFAGQFIDRRSALGPWLLNEPQAARCVDLVRGDQLQQHPLIPRSVAGLGPDFVLVNRKSASGWKSPKSHFETHLFAVWTVLDFDLGLDRSEHRLLSLDERLADLKLDVPLKGLLVQPDVEVERPSQLELEHCRTVRLTLPLQQHVASLVAQLNWAWEALC